MQNLLLFRSLPFAHDLEYFHVRINCVGNFINLWKACDLKLVQGFLLVDPDDLFLCVGESLLHGPHIKYVLLHHIQLAIVTELISTLLQLLQLNHHFLALLSQLQLTLCFPLIHKLQTASHA